MGFVDGGSLLVRIRCAFGANLATDPLTWTWTDVTAYWHVDDQVDLSWGGSSGASKLETSSLGLTLKNTDSRFTAYHPASPYWPHVREWVPIQYDIDLGDGVGWRNKFSGFVKNWAVRWPGASALMSTCRIAAVGELGRQERGRPPARSPMRRTLAASGPAAYWPGEDGAAAGWAASAFPGHPPLTIDGPAQFKPESDYVRTLPGIKFGTAALIDLAGGASMSVAVPAAVTAATTTGFVAYVVLDFDPATISGDLIVVDVGTASGERWRLTFTTGLNTWVSWVDSAGVATPAIAVGSVQSTFSGVDFAVWQDGANTRVGLNYDLATGTYVATGLVAVTMAGVTEIKVNPTKVTQGTPLPVGHLAVWAGQPMPLEPRNAELSYATALPAENVDDRLDRLRTEDGVSLVIPAVSAGFETPMGNQPVGTFLDLAGQCVDADQGLLREDGFGFGFVPREHRYNQPVTLTIDAAAGQLGMPFEPVSEDPNRRNMWTVKREGGSSAVVRDQALIDVQGEIEGSVTVHHRDDSLLEKYAFSRLRQTTVQEPRYPALSVNLGAHPELAADWCSVRRGSRIQVTNPPAQNVPGTIDQIVVGARETFRGRRSWKATMNVEPASPWTFITDTFTRTVAGGWGTSDSGHVWTASDAALSVTGGAGRITHAASGLVQNELAGTALADVTVAAVVGISAKLTGAGAVTPGVMLRLVDSANYYVAELFYQASGGATGNVGLVLGKVVAGSFAGLYLNFTFDVYDGSETFWLKAQAVGSTVRIKAWRTTASEPAGWTAEVSDATFAAGSVGVLSNREAGITNVNPFVTFGDFAEVRF